MGADQLTLRNRRSTSARPGGAGTALGDAPAGRAEVLRLHRDQVPDDVLRITQPVAGQSERGHPPLREVATGSRAACGAGHPRTLSVGPDTAGHQATHRPGTVRAMRIAITGAAGGIGTVLRRQLDPIPVRAGGAGSGAGRGHPARRIPATRPARPDQLADAFADVQAVVHLGAVPHEDTFETILEHNIVGTRNLYDAAVAAGANRVVFASSAHVTGFYPWGQADRSGRCAPPRHLLRAVQAVRGEPRPGVPPTVRYRGGQPADRRVRPGALGSVAAFRLALVRRRHPLVHRRAHRAGRRFPDLLRGFGQHQGHAQPPGLGRARLPSRSTTPRITRPRGWTNRC